MFRVRLVLFACTFGIVAFHHQSPVSAVAVGNFPLAVGINAQTNRIYATNFNSNTVSVIDGATSAVIATIPLEPSVASSPRAADVNPITNRVYVGTHGTSLTVIDGASNTILTNRAYGIETADVVVNPDTNRVYLVGGNNTQKLIVVDGTSYQTIAEPTVGSDPHYVAVNRTTNRIYVSNNASGFLSVVDGATNAVSSIPLSTGFFWTGVDVNPVTNLVYVANEIQNFIEVIDANTNLSVGTIGLPPGTIPVDLAVNPNNNRIYVASYGRDTLMVIDGASGVTLNEIPVGDGPRGARLNLTTGRIYVPNGDSSNVSVILESELLANSSFDRDADSNGLPDSWVTSNTGGSDGLDADIPDVYDGRFSLRFVGIGRKAKQASQIIPFSGPPGTALNLEAFSKSESAAVMGPYQVRLQVSYIDGTMAGTNLNFSKGTHGWERKFRTFTTTKNFGSVTVSARYGGTGGTVWFDGLHVWPSP